MLSRTLGTVSGNRALIISEPLIFELGQPGLTALRQPKFEETIEAIPREALRTKPIGLPGLSEPTVVRHYTKLSQKNFSIDTGMYPLGSCTMKFNPRLNEAMCRLPGFAEVHPLQPSSTVQGALKALHVLGQNLMSITGMGGICMSGGAGSHGELIGLMCIRRAHMQSGQDDKRKVVLCPTSAHGTNPASAALCGYKVRPVELNSDGSVNMDDLRQNLSKGDVAAFMLTNPSTVGMFEPNCAEMAKLVHEAGAYFYMDGANFNAIMGRTRPADLGVDVMHFNLHKTFSTPHGGGGPGSGPIVLSSELAQYAPVPKVMRRGEAFDLVEEPDDKCLGRVKGFHGQVGVCVRALAYIMAMGEEGLKNVSGDAVLNANYVLARLKNVLSPAFPGRLCMHECLFSDDYLKDTGVTTLDMAKALIDEGYHPPTMYFPLVVHGALLVEPSESESRESLDQFCGIMTKLVERVKAGQVDYFKQAPVHAPVRRCDETSAAINPILVHKQ